MIELVRYCRRSSKSVYLLVAVAVVGAALGMALTILLGEIVATIPAMMNGEDLGHFVWLITFLILVFALEGLQPALLDMASRRTIYDVEPMVHQQIIGPLLEERGIRHLEDPAVQDCINQARGIGSFGVRTGIEVLGTFIFARATALGAAVIVGLWFSWPIALAVLATTWFLEWYSARLLIAESDQWADQTEEQRRTGYVFDISMDRATKEIRVFGLSEWFVNRYISQWRKAMAPLWKERRAAAIKTTGAYGIHLVVLLGAVSYAGYLASQGVLELAAVTTVIVALLRLGMAGDGHSASRLQRGMEAYHAIHRLPKLVEIDTHVNGFREYARDSQDDAKCEFEAIVSFEDVWFRYPNTQTDVLKGVTLKIMPGRSTALVGINGAGKSTIVKLLAGVYHPTQGTVRVQGEDIRNLSNARLAEWQKHVAVIMQDFVRLPLSAAENVVMGAPSTVPTTLLNETAELTGASETVDRLSGGWRTPLDKSYAGGTEISGGQWQRLALARAVLSLRRGASILVLDEPAAALDVRAEAEMVDRYLELTQGSPSLIISHRFSVVRGTDCIQVLDQGRIVESGTHQDLLELGGRYAAMFRAQADRYLEGNVDV